MALLAETRPTTELCQAYGVFDQFVFTKSAGLLGGFECDGIDPDSKSEEDYSRFTNALRAMYQHTIKSNSDDVIFSQYYIHYEGVKVSLQKRDNPRSEVLSRKRERFLNSHRVLSGSRLFHFIELPTTQNLNTLASIETIKNIGSYPFDKKARQLINEKLNNLSAVMVHRSELKERAEKLNDEIESWCQKLDFLQTPCSQLSINELWATFRAILNFNPDYLTDSVNEPIPRERWDALIFDGDIQQVVIDGMDLIKINGVEPTYIRIASIMGLGADSVPEGVFAQGQQSPIMQSGNYIIMNRFRPISMLKRAKMFFQKEAEIERASFSIAGAIKGADQMSQADKMATMKDSTKRLLKELDEAQALTDRYGNFSSHIALFGTDLKKLKAQSKAMNNALTQSGCHVVWEKTGHLMALENFMPGYNKGFKREMDFTSTQYGAASLAYRSSEGLRHWGEKDNRHEAVYIFEADDNTPFYFSPFIGGRCVVIGIGPIRSGKSFTKNTLASHFLKYGGFLSAIDIDPGTEPIAEFFGEDGGIFRTGMDKAAGFNPFAIARDENDDHFKAHLSAQLRLMLQVNDNSEMREFDSDEQKEVDSGIKKVLRLDKSLQSLSALVNHCSPGVRAKLQRFTKGGMYGHFFDNTEDAIGTLSTRVQVFNLASVKDMPQIKPLVMNEIFYRTTRLFENPDLRDQPKYLDVDECHSLLSIKEAAEYLVSRIRTWGKWNGGVGLWSQSPKEFADIPDWAAIRSAATTFFFMADSELERSLYKKAFPNLTDGHLDAISRLTPKKQAFIWQPEIGVAKVVNLRVEPEQYVINTSNPYEADLRRKNVANSATFDEAINKTVTDLKREIIYED